MRTVLLRLATLGAVAVCAVMFAPAANAAPASPSFLAQWKKADQQYAAWNLVGAQQTLNPLLSQSASLEGYDRVWFDYSATRLLTVVGRTPQAAVFAADQKQVVGDRTQSCSANYYSSPCVSTTGYTFWKGRSLPQQDHCVPGLSPELSGESLSLENLAVIPPVHINVPNVPGGQGLVMSYFAGHIGKLCDVYLGRFSGGPTGPLSGTSKFVVVIPTAERIITRRKIKRGGKIKVQAFATGSKKLIATWKPVKKGKKIRLQYKVSNNVASIRAPRKAGRYNLQLGIGKPKDFATGVSDVRVK